MTRWHGKGSNAKKEILLKRLLFTSRRHWSYYLSHRAAIINKINEICTHSLSHVIDLCVYYFINEKTEKWLFFHLLSFLYQHMKYSFSIHILSMKLLPSLKEILLSLITSYIATMVSLEVTSHPRQKCQYWSVTFWFKLYWTSLKTENICNIQIH